MAFDHWQGDLENNVYPPFFYGPNDPGSYNTNNYLLLIIRDLR